MPTYKRDQRLCLPCNRKIDICGRAITDYTCKSCFLVKAWPNTCVPTYCGECSDKLNRCMKCGAALKKKVFNPNTKNVLYMLRESNAIEDVWDRQALVNAHRAWKYIMMFDQLNNGLIKDVHYLLMTGLPIPQKYRGDFRDVPIWIGGEKKAQPKPVIDSLMRDFCDHVNEVLYTKRVNHDAIHCHLQFEGIHPFIDGNGRMGRIILNWQLVKLGMPLLIYTQADVKTYYRLFPSYRRMEMERVTARLEHYKFLNAKDL